MVIRRLVTDEALVEVYQLSKKVLVEECGYLPDDGSILQDKYDSHTHNYAAFNESGSIIGVIRLVVNNSFSLPLERLYPLNKIRSGKRMAESLSPDYSKRKPFVAFIS
jgi:hypothetical protein